MQLSFIGCPSCLTPQGAPWKGDIPNKYPLYKVYMGLIIKGTIPKGTSIFFPWVRKVSPSSIPSEAVPTLLEQQELLHSHLAERLMFWIPLFSAFVFWETITIHRYPLFWICNFSCFLVINLIFFHFLAVESEVRKKNSWPGGQNFEKKSQNGWNVQLLNDPTIFFLKVFEFVQKNPLAPPKKTAAPVLKQKHAAWDFKKLPFQEAPCGWSHLEVGLGGLSLSWMDIILGEKI